MSARSCPACGSHRSELVHQLRLRTPDGHPLGDGYDVVSCMVCGTGFADVTVPQEYYDRYYAESAKYAAEVATSDPSPPTPRVFDAPGRTSAYPRAENRGLAAEPPWKAERLDAAAARISELVHHPNARILDIGCANGTLLGALRRRGYADVRGVDPSPSSAAMAAEHHGVRVDVGTFSALPAGLGTFDCVCLTGVLEHVLDVEGAMASALALLKPDGVVYIDAPDASRYLDPFIAPFEDFSSEHVNHFSPLTLETLARRFGLVTLWSERFVTELVAGVPCAALRMAWRRWPHPSLSPASPAPPSASRPSSSGPAVQNDVELPAVLRRFTIRSVAQLARIDAQLDSELGEVDEFAVWGVGEFTM